MKKNILSVISTVLVLVFMFSLTISAQSLKNNNLPAGNQTRAEKQRFDNARLENVQITADIQNIRRQAQDIIRQIIQNMRGATEEQFGTDADYIAIKTILATAKTTLQNNENKNSIKDDLKAYRDLLKTDTVAAAAKLEEMKATLAARKVIFDTLIADLNTALEKSKAFAAAKKANIEERNAFRQAVNAKKTIVSQNHVAIVKAEINCRTVINQIIATVAANKDLLATKQTELAAVTAKLQATRDAIKALKDGSIKTASKEFNELRAKKDFTVALAKLDSIITIQTTRLTALADLNTQLKAELAEIDAIIATATPATTTVETTSAA